MTIQQIQENLDKELKDQKDSKSFPFEALPEILSSFGVEFSKNLQVADSIVGTNLISIASLLTQDKANIHIGYRKIPINLFTLVVADSGERKTTVDKILLEGIREKEKRDFAEMGFDSRINPKILLQEPTMEGIVTQFESGRNSLGLFSDEGAKMIGGYSMGRQVTTAGYLSNFWDGTPIERTRFQKKSVRSPAHITPTLFNKRLSACLMVQRPVFHRVWKNIFLQEQGLLARFLICQPIPLAGTRIHSFEEKNTELESLKSIFDKRVLELLEELDLPKEHAEYYNECPPMRSLSLSERSVKLHLEFCNEVEKELGEGGIYQPVKTFAAKIAEQSLRLAGVFTLFEDSNAECIEEEMYEKGVIISRWYLQEVVRISKNDVFEDTSRHQQEVLNILNSRNAKGKRGLSIRDIIHRCATPQIRNKKRVLAILESLEKAGSVFLNENEWSYNNNIDKTL